MAYHIPKPRRRKKSRKTSRRTSKHGYIVVAGRGRGRKCLKTTFRSKAKAAAAARRTSKRTGRSCRVRQVAVAARRRRTSRHRRTSR